MKNEFFSYPLFLLLFHLLFFSSVNLQECRQISRYNNKEWIRSREKNCVVSLSFKSTVIQGLWLLIGRLIQG